MDDLCGIGWMERTEGRGRRSEDRSQKSEVDPQITQITRIRKRGAGRSEVDPVEYAPL